MSSPDKIEFFEVGDKTSLICVDPATVDAAKATMSELGFKYHTAETPELAVERIRYNNYDCIILHEGFAGSSLRSNIVLHYLASLPMAQRRQSFVCLVGPSFKTFDAMQAFGQSVHLVVNPGDLPNLEPILKKGLAEYEQLYHVYNETLSSIS